MSEWLPIESAPKDGTVIMLTWMDHGRPADTFPMQWCHIQQNGLFPGKIGMWATSDGNMTWNDDAGGGPTHWAPLKSA